MTIETNTIKTGSSHSNRESFGHNKAKPASLSINKYKKASTNKEDLAEGE